MNENKGIMPTKVELTLEQSQQGVSDDVLVSIEGVEELKEIIWHNTWFLGLEDVLSWLLVEGKRNATTVDINAIALLRQEIGSSPSRNTGIARPESNDEVLHKLVSMVEKNELFEELMIVVMDTEQNLIKLDS
ncbi:hypothetical protein Tco_1408198 [Tanacetum coccineum]